ncbi:hypothetical protein Q7P36_000268 [Cladosporium allicinum]
MVISPILRYKRRMSLIGGEYPPTMSAAESNSTAPSTRTYPFNFNLPRSRLLYSPSEQDAAAAVAAPIHYPQKPLVPGSSSSGTCDSIDKFTMQWFLENTKPEYRREIIGKALFYTAGASEAARKLACGPDEKYVTIWQIWKPECYDDSLSPDNPLRCIHANLTLTHTYYSRMSNAYARMARESATVMHKTQDYDNPPMNGIWGKTELPALRYETDVKEMMKINEDNTLTTKWPLLNKGPPNVVRTAIEEITNIFLAAGSSLSKRADSNSQACELWDKLKVVFDEQYNNGSAAGFLTIPSFSSTIAAIETCEA